MLKIFCFCLLLLSCTSLSKSISDQDHGQIDKFLEQESNVNITHSTPQGRKETADKMASIISILKEYGAK